MPRPFSAQVTPSYAQVALFLKSALVGPGSWTLHVLPLTVSVRQYVSEAAEATVRVGETPESIATSSDVFMRTYVPLSA